VSLHKVANFYKEAGYQWKFKEGFRVPTEEEIETTVFLAIDALKTEPDRAQLEVGRLVVQKNGQFYDVYVQMAEIPI
jgi:hypothetical protein